MTYAAIRLRGKINLKPDIKKTLQLLNLTKTNHCVILPETASIKGMLQVTKDFITWGEIEEETLTKLLKNRGKLTGDKPLTDEHVQNATSYKDLQKISEAIIKDKIKYNEIPDIKPVFRLSPAKKGLRSIKRTYNKKGSIGYRGKDINQLIERMI